VSKPGKIKHKHKNAYQVLAQTVRGTFHRAYILPINFCRRFCPPEPPEDHRPTGKLWRINR